VEPDIVEPPRPDAPYLQYLAAHAKYIEAVSVQPRYDHDDVHDVTTSILAADFLLPKILHPGEEDEARKAAEEAAEAVAAAASMLAFAGVRSGDRVAASLGNEANLIIAFYEIEPFRVVLWIPILTISMMFLFLMFTTLNYFERKPNLKF
jgi:hypothetical protein